MAARQVLNGRYAEAAIGGVLLALLTDWEVHFKTEEVDFAGPGDYWAYRQPFVTDWYFTAKGWASPNASPQYINSLWQTTGPQAQFQVRGYAGSVASGTKIFEGVGYAVEGSFLVPMGVASNGFKLVGYGPPTVGLHA